MPQYFFDVHDDDNYRDTIGVCLPDLHAAKREAVKTASGMINDTESSLRWGGESWTMRVRGEAGEELLTLRLLMSERS